MIPHFSIQQQKSSNKSQSQKSSSPQQSIISHQPNEHFLKQQDPQNNSNYNLQTSSIKSLCQHLNIISTTTNPKSQIKDKQNHRTNLEDQPLKKLENSQKNNQKASKGDQKIVRFSQLKHLTNYEEQSQQSDEGNKDDDKLCRRYSFYGQSQNQIQLPNKMSIFTNQAFLKQAQQKSTKATNTELHTSKRTKKAQQKPLLAPNSPKYSLRHTLNQHKMSSPCYKSSNKKKSISSQKQKLHPINYKILFNKQIQKNQLLKNYISQIKQKNNNLKKLIKKNKKSSNNLSKFSHKFNHPPPKKTHQTKTVSTIKTQQTQPNKTSITLFQIIQQLKYLNNNVKKVNKNVLKLSHSIKDNSAAKQINQNNQQIRQSNKIL